MKKTFLLTMISLILFSCGVDHSDYEGKWIDNKYEKKVVNIEKNGKNYLVQINNEKYPAQIKDELLEISMGLPIKATIDNNDVLIIAGDEYIRYAKSKKQKFIGQWKEKGEKPYWSLLIKIDDNNNLIIIDKRKFASEIDSKFTNIRYKNGVISAVNKYAVDSYHRDKVTIELIKDDEISFKLNPENISHLFKE